MNKNTISKVIYTMTVSITIITFVLIVIKYFMGEYSIELLVEGTFFVSLVLIFMLLLPRLEKYFKIDLPINIRVQLYLFVFGLLIVGNVYNLINHTLWFDKILHFISGSFLASIGILFANKWIQHSSKRIKGYVAFMYSLSITLLWEIIEFVSDIFVSTVYPSYEYTMQFFHIEKEVWILPQPFGLVDTMLDITLGVLGAFLLVTYYCLTQKDINNSR